MNGFLPTPKYEFDIEWRWPWWKFELPPDALFTTLHERFNTRRPPIQGPEAFLLDVRECAQESNDVDTFYTKLSQRRDQRVVELDRAWNDVCYLMDEELWTATTGCLNCKSKGIDDKDPRDLKNEPRMHRWSTFVALSRSMSFDYLVGFFDSFVRERREIEDEKRRKSDADLGGLLSREKLGYDAASVVGRDRAVPEEPSASTAAGPVLNPSDSNDSGHPIPPKSTPGNGVGAAEMAPKPPNVSAPELPITRKSAPSDETDAIQNGLAQDARDTTNQPIAGANAEAKSIKTRLSPSSTSRTPPRGRRPTQKNTTVGGQQQATDTLSGTRKRDRSGLRPG